MNETIDSTATETTVVATPSNWKTTALKLTTQVVVTVAINVAAAVITKQIVKALDSRS